MKRVFQILIPVLYILFLLAPIYWLINMSFKTNTEITGAFSLWPRGSTAPRRGRCSATSSCRGSRTCW